MAGLLLKPETVAEMLGMSPSWVYARKHEIGYVQFGSAIRFEQKEVEEYAQRCKRGPRLEERDIWESQSDTGKNATAGWLRKRTTVSDINERLKGIDKEKSKHESTLRNARLS